MSSVRELHLGFHAAVSAVLLAVPVVIGVGFARLDETVAARGRLDFTALSPVTSRSSARVRRVLCREGQRVAQGDVLFQLEEDDFRLERDQLASKLEGLQKSLEELEASLQLLRTRQHPRELAELAQRLRGAEHEQELRRLAKDQNEGLRAKEVVSSDEVAVAQGTLGIATAKRYSLIASLDVQRARHERELQDLDRTLTAQRAEIRGTQLALQRAEQAVADASIRAPIAGFVLTRNPERLVGRRFAAGETMVEMAEPADLAFVIEIDERDLAKIAIGQEVLVNLDAFPFYVYQSFPGAVEGISRAAESGARGGSAFRVMVRLRTAAVEVDVNNSRQLTPLQPGLSGEAVVMVNRNISLTTYLFRGLGRRLPAHMTVY